MVAVPGENRFPIVYVDLQRNSSPGTERPPTLSGGDTGGAREHAGNGAASKLREIQSLYDRGLISDDEYRRIRSRIVGGL
ncbi:MAG: SHOCT domain-containing protein [Candidatus Binatia bacterium]